MYGIEKDTECCLNCKHFVKHYTWWELMGELRTCHGGHCCYPRMKSRKVYDVCDHFEKGSREVCPFVREGY